MAAQQYVFPKDTSGGYRWHITEKCLIAIGRTFKRISDDEFGHTILMFDPPLTPEELPLIEAIFEGGNAQAPPPADPGTKFIIRDAWYSTFMPDLAAELGCDVSIWFTKSSPELENTDLIELHFTKLLTVQDKKTVQYAVDDLMVGWV